MRPRSSSRSRNSQPPPPPSCCRLDHDVRWNSPSLCNPSLPCTTVAPFSLTVPNYSIAARDLSPRIQGSFIVPFAFFALLPSLRTMSDLGVGGESCGTASISSFQFLDFFFFFSFIFVVICSVFRLFSFYFY